MVTSPAHVKTRASEIAISNADSRPNIGYFKDYYNNQKKQPLSGNNSGLKKS
jgi:hypothetical protein